MFDLHTEINFTILYNVRQIEDREQRKFLQWDSIWIDDIGDGGSKGDKFERDIRLLKQGLEEEPNNGRYYFYLAIFALQHSLVRQLVVDLLLNYNCIEANSQPSLVLLRLRQLNFRNVK